MTNLVVMSLVLGEIVIVLIAIAAVLLGDWGRPQQLPVPVHARQRYRQRH